MRGAFTGANQDRRGLFEEANGGTLFLDEIANMSLETQAKLLRALQEEEVRPLGSNRARKVDVRIIVAASEDLKQKATSGEFRTDLFYRLNVVPLRLPRLRERREDIPVLAAHFLNRFSLKHGRQLHSIAVPTLAILERYTWPGNVRELENAIERAVILAADKDTRLLPEHLPYELSFPESQGRSPELPHAGNLETLLADYEREILLNALRHHDWNKSAAAAITLTSTLRVRLDPSGRTSSSCRTRSNFAWVSRLMLAISSRKRVPPLASSNKPHRS